MHRSIRFAVLAALGACSPSAFAQCPSSGVSGVDEHVGLYHGVITAHGPAVIALPAWDPATHPDGARLVRVALRARVRLETDARTENINPNTTYSVGWQSTKNVTFRAPASLGVPEGQFFVSIRDGARLFSFDGVIDFAGPSGKTWLGRFDEQELDEFVQEAPAELASWTGPGAIEFEHFGWGTELAWTLLPGNAIHLQSSFALEVELDYTWCTPELGATYCFGDGSGAPCPCSNPGTTGTGCANSTAVGASLVAIGSASVAADDLELVAAGLVPRKPVLLFAGDLASGGGDGLPFRDGLRCAGGDVHRLEVRFADAFGGASFGPGLSAAGGLTAGETRYFQAWYRDPQGPCGTGSNLSSAVELALLP